MREPRTVNVLGVGVSAIDMKEALALTDLALQSRRKGYICVTGVHGIMEGQKDPEFRDILNRSFINTPDGMPTVWVGRMQGFSEMGRVFGPDFMLRMCALSVKRSYTHFLYGGAPGVADDLRRNLLRRFPRLRIVGTYTPPFRPLNEEEQRALLDHVRGVQPDIIWVGLSTPKQERFMAEFLPRLETRLMIGVGAAFDIHTGRIKDAPHWVKNVGLQWLHRLLQEPGRLWKRYLVNNPRFLWNITFQLLGVRRFDLS
jgi:N-acetylglucosaminyldiphosphoundecaprenol N-acetyl-beta-D-mannosaminyltransferase